MQLIRFFFTKQGEAAYISHLDLQRVMARALRRSGIPVWYSQGFNPHIYITFALPMPLMQESICESMDCKTESEAEDFSQYIPRLNESLPRGIEVSRIAVPVYAAGDITSALYTISWEYDSQKVKEALEGYNALNAAMVLRKTKRTEQMVDLKEVQPVLQLNKTGELCVKLPAGSTLNYNPELILRFLEDTFGLPVSKANILRTKILVKDEIEFN